ncbi:MAG: 30S ribosomal protein S17e [Candidatus Thorarchaeota archaeon]
MGSIRQGYIKIAARKIFQDYRDELTADFETNKRIVEQYTDVKSKTVRNRLAGYLVTVVKRETARQNREATQNEEPIDTEM